MPVRVYDWKNKVFFPLRALTTADPTDLFTLEDIASISPSKRSTKRSSTDDDEAKQHLICCFACGPSCLPTCQRLRHLYFSGSEPDLDDAECGLSSTPTTCLFLSIRLWAAIHQQSSSVFVFIGTVNRFTLIS